LAQGPAAVRPFEAHRAPLLGLGGADDAPPFEMMTVVSMTLEWATKRSERARRRVAPVGPLWPMLGGIDRRRAVRQFVAACG
jgi:hypothetical protein